MNKVEGVVKLRYKMTMDKEGSLKTVKFLFVIMEIFAL